MVIVAAVDHSDRSTRIIREAETLAKAFDDTVHVVYALTRSEFLDLGISGAQSDEPLDMDQIRAVAAETAAEAAADLDVPYEVVGLVGDAAEEVTIYAEEQEARYIIVGPRKRSRTGKALFGSVAQSILLNASCPVVTDVEQETT